MDSVAALHDSAPQGEWTRSHCDPDGAWEEVHVAFYVGCGRQADGCVECWGDPWHDTTTVDAADDATRAPPRMFSSLVVPTYEGDWSWDLAPYACGDTEGGLFCWGLGRSGFQTSQPGLASLSGTPDYLCGLQGDGTVHCPYESGKPGDFIDNAPSAGNLRALALPGMRTSGCSLTDAGRLECWSSLHGPEDPHWSELLPDTEAISLGRSSAEFLLIAESGDVVEWGADIGTVTRLAAVDGDPFIDATGGPWEGCGLAASGRLSCWGTWAGLEPDASFEQISLGCGVTVDGTIECWSPTPAPAILEVP